jgi:DNA-damage-inducible protein D
MNEDTERQEPQKREVFPLPHHAKWDAIHQVFFQGENYYRVTDVIDALEVASDASNYWSLMKGRLKTEGFQQARQELVQFEVKTPKDKRFRKHDYATRRTLLRIAQSIPSPLLEDLKIWLADTGEQRLRQEEVDRVQAELDKIRADYQSQGRSSEWIEDRIQNIVGRNALTDQWRKRGAVEHLHFARLTAILHQGALGVTPEQHRQIKQLPGRTNPREHMDRVELALVTLAEATATARHIENDTQGVPGLEKDVRAVAKTSEVIRELTEQNLGRSVVSSQNFLDQTRGRKGKKHLSPVQQAFLFESEPQAPRNETQ